MNNNSVKIIKKKRFAIGIFLMLFFIESIIAAGAITAYFIHSGKKRIEDIEKYTRNYSLAMSEAFADVAELSYRKGKYSKLKSLFREKIQDNIIDEAFFVLNNGKLVIHSSKEIEKKLDGNIANDEFAYNLDLLLKRSKEKSKKAFFSDYNIMGKKIPRFPIKIGSHRDHKKILKKYLYKKINYLGWLVSIAVYIKKKPVGTVNFIISKDRIYNFITSHINETKKLLIYSFSGAALLSLIVSVIVLIRYRSIQDKTIQYSVPETRSEPEKSHIKIVEDTSGKIFEIDEEPIVIELLAEIDDDKVLRKIEEEINQDPVNPVIYDDEPAWNMEQEIKDAIPIMRKK